jgi:homeobox protein cut-like
MEDLMQEKLVQKENELNATYDERLRNYEERWVYLSLKIAFPLTSTYSEQDLQRQVSLTKNQLRDLRMSNDSNQAKLLDHSSRQGNISSKIHTHLALI